MRNRSRPDAHSYKNVVLLSNYSWAYLSAAVVKRHFSNGKITLVTTNIKDVAKKHNFGMDIIEIEKSISRGIFQFMRVIRTLAEKQFEAVVVDYGFNLNTTLLIFGTRAKALFIVDLNAENPIRMITKFDFLKILIGKWPYFLNKMLIQFSRGLRMSLSLGFPSEIYIETTTICNLRCKGCPTGIERLTRPAMPMPGDLFENILQKNRSNFRYFDTIYPFTVGEPLLNNHIFEWITKLRSISYPYTRIELHTNGNIRNSEKMATRLLTSGLDLISISLDGADKLAYENFRRGGNFELVCEFVKNLASEKKRLGLFKPEIVIQMILTRYSEGHANEFERLKDELGADRFVFKGFFHEFAGLPDEVGYSLAPSKREFAFTAEDKKEVIVKKENRCGWIYRSITVLCNGDIAPCCIDFNASLLDGLNLYNSTIRNIWNSLNYKHFRKNMLQGNIKLCKGCFMS